MATLEANDILKQGSPIKVFSNWFHAAQKSTMKHPEAFVLSTIYKETEGATAHEGLLIPNSRVVLMKEITDDGIIFYTNYESQKGREINSQPHAAAVFYWDPLFQQVKLMGPLHKVSRQKSEDYWRQRARNSQISQWVSIQSQPVPNREQMDHEFNEAEKKFLNKDIPCPEHWGGYLLTPTYVELWLGREGRFHDRYAYRKVENRWLGQRLYP